LEQSIPPADTRIADDRSRRRIGLSPGPQVDRRRQPALLVNGPPDGRRPGLNGSPHRTNARRAGPAVCSARGEGRGRRCAVNSPRCSFWDQGIGRAESVLQELVGRLSARKTIPARTGLPECRVHRLLGLPVAPGIRVANVGKVCPGKRKCFLFFVMTANRFSVTTTDPQVVGCSFGRG